MKKYRAMREEKCTVLIEFEIDSDGYDEGRSRTRKNRKPRYAVASNDVTTKS